MTLRAVNMWVGLVCRVGPIVGENAVDMWLQLEIAAREIDCAVREMIGEVYEKALAVLRRNRRALGEGDRLLVEKEALTPGELPPLSETRLARA